jgi:hypothetical protein
MILESAFIALGSSTGNPTNQTLLSQKTPPDKQVGILGALRINSFIYHQL